MTINDTEIPVVVATRGRIFDPPVVEARRRTAVKAASERTLLQRAWAWMRETPAS